MTSVATFSTCAIRSNSNRPPSATIFPVSGWTTTNTAVTHKLITAKTPVQRRCASLSSRSNMRIVHAASERNISGHAYTRPELKTLGLNEPEIILALRCDLGEQQLFGQVLRRGAHHIEQRRRP